MIILEIDNPHHPNLDVKTNQNLKLILQHLIKDINGQIKKNVNGPPPSTNSLGRPDIQSNNSGPCNTTSKACETNAPILCSLKAVSKSQNNIQKSFGMDKKYLNKKIRQSLDRKLRNIHGKKLSSFIALWQKTLNSHSAFSTPKKQISKLIPSEKSTNPPDLLLQEKEKSKKEIKDVFETNWITPSSSLSDERSHSNSISNKTENSLQFIETTNHAEIHIRFQDTDDNSKEHYRIRVTTDEDSFIRGVRPQLPCTMLNDTYCLAIKQAQYNDKTLDSKQTNQIEESNLVLALDLQSFHWNGSSYSNSFFKSNELQKTQKKLNIDEKKKENINNFNTSRKAYYGDIMGFFNQNLSEIRPNVVGSIFKDNCGHTKHLSGLDKPIAKLNDLKTVSVADWFMESSSVKGKCDDDKINIGVNTDSSLLENLMKNFQPVDSENSYACDLSMCLSTDNDVSEGEIGFFAFRSQSSCLCKKKPFSCTCMTPESSSKNLRKSRMLQLQQLTDIFLTYQ